MDRRIDVGEEAEISWIGIYEYDGLEFEGAISLNDTKKKDVVGKYLFTVKNISDPLFGLTAFKSNSVYAIFDRVNITLRVEDPRIDIGEKANLSWTGFYEYDGSSFTGSLLLNDTLRKEQVGRYGFTVTSISDPLYNLTAFIANEVYCIWDRIKIIDGGVSNTRSLLGDTEKIWFKAIYDYDGEVFDGAYGVLLVNNSEMSWSTSNNRWEYNYTATSPGPKTFIVTGVLDERYGLETIEDLVGSQSITFYVPTSISFQVDTSSTFVGFRVRLVGTLSYLNGTGVSGVNVILTYSVTGGESWNEITSVNTSADGDFIAEWMPTATGNYLIRVSWAGNETLYIQGTETTTTLAVLPMEEKYVFSVISNSTISGLYFDSENREIGFTLSGPPNTYGYTNVTISKDLIRKIEYLKVYLDEEEISYQVISKDDSWLVHFTYQHSTHNVIITLGPAPTPFIFTPIGLTGIGGIIALMVILAIIISRRRTT